MYTYLIIRQFVKCQHTPTKQDTHSGCYTTNGRMPSTHPLANEKNVAEILVGELKVKVKDLKCL